MAAAISNTPRTIAQVAITTSSARAVMFGVKKVMTPAATPTKPTEDRGPPPFSFTVLSDAEDDRRNAVYEGIGAKEEDQCASVTPGQKT